MEKSLELCGRLLERLDIAATVCTFENNNKTNCKFIPADMMSSSYFLGLGIYRFMKDAYQTK